MRINLVLGISAGGSTAAAIIQATKTGLLQGAVNPVLVIASSIRDDTHEVAKQFESRGLGVPVQPLPPNGPGGAEVFGAALLALCEAHGGDFFGQYGFMPQMPRNVIEYFDNGRRMINQHPGPVPRFGGKGMYGRRVLLAQLLYERRRCVSQPEAVVIAQRVGADGNYDSGRVIHYKRVPILPSDTVETLQPRTLAAEHATQIEALEMIIDGQDIEHDCPNGQLPDIGSWQGHEHLGAKVAAIRAYPHG